MDLRASNGVRALGQIVLWTYLAGTAVALVAWLNSDGDPVLRATFLALVSVSVALVLIHLASGRDSGKRRIGILWPIVGVGGHISTSLAQVATWTLIIVTALAWLLFQGIDDGASLDDLIPADRWDQYLILLGGPFASAVLAKFVVSSKSDAGQVQTPVADEAQVSQVVRNDKGQPDLVDAQYTLFNVVAQVYVVVTTVGTRELPEIPATLLALTGLTSATYVAAKAARKNPPVITAVTPGSLRTGKKVRIHGQNFDPDGSRDSRRVYVTFTGSAWQKELAPPNARGAPEGFTDTQAWFTLVGLRKGDYELVLTTTAGVATEPWTIKVV